MSPPSPSPLPVLLLAGLPVPRHWIARALVLAGLILGLGSRCVIADDPPPDGRASLGMSLDAALATIERHAVRVHFSFQRDLGADALGREPVDPASWTEQLRRWRMTWRITGYVVKDRRTVVSSDHFSAPGTVKSIEIRTTKGATVPVAAWEFLPHAKLCVFRTATDLDTEPLSFPTAGEEVGLPLVVGNVTEGTSGLETWADTLTVARRRTGDATKAHGFDFAARADAGLAGAGLTNRVDLVMRPDGRALGFRIGTPFDLDPAHWTGSAIVADLEHSVPLVGLAERARSLNDDSFVHEVRVTFRRDEGGESEAGFPGFAFGGPAAAPDEARYYGYSIAPNLLLVPQPVPDALVRRIEKVTVEDEGDPIIEATYEGRVKGTGAFVVRLLGATLEAPPAEASIPPPPAGQAFLVHRVSRRAGSRRDSVTYDRSHGLQPGYGDRPFFASEQAVPQGSFLMDLDGRVFGVATELRPEDAERTSKDRTRASHDGYGTIAALFAEGGGPSEWLKSLEKRTVPQKSEESRRLPWLGVEYVAVHGADVAEALEVSQPTRDGTRGLLVNVVYADSPAAKAGLRVDDLLLSAKRTSGPGCDAPPVDLKESSDDALFLGSSGEDGGAPAPWAPRRNALVKLLESFELGTTYDLELWREGAPKTISLTVEQSPRDVESALVSRDDGTGITVKELTYEVRAALHLGRADAGVLVSTIEEGMAAFQARINVNELIRELDGGPVADPAAFAKGLADARAAGKASVRIVVARLDRSRFVDLRLSGTDAPPSVPGMAPPK